MVLLCSAGACDTKALRYRVSLVLSAAAVLLYSGRLGGLPCLALARFLVRIRYRRDPELYVKGSGPGGRVGKALHILYVPTKYRA